MATRTQRLIVFALVAVPLTIGMGIWKNWDWLLRSLNLQPEQEFTNLEWQPAPSSLAERARGGLIKIGVLPSSTVPVSASVANIPFGQDADLSPVVTGSAKIFRFENPEYCNSDGQCEFAIISTSGDERIFKDFVMMTPAKNISIGSHKVNGNPDLLLDYGNGAPPQQLRWKGDPDMDYPRYEIIEAFPPEQR